MTHQEPEDSTLISTVTYQEPEDITLISTSKQVSSNFDVWAEVVAKLGATYQELHRFLSPIVSKFVLYPDTRFVWVIAYAWHKPHIIHSVADLIRGSIDP